MADRLRVTELDFDAIKTNLKTFLKQQSEFTDYDFEGSGLSVLIDILAYNTHYNAYYLNMVANEAFLDTSLLRDSVVSHAKSLGYVPSSRTAPEAIINFTVTSTNTADSSLTLPKGYNFFSNQIDGKSYNFVTLADTTVSKVNGTFKFENLQIYEGQVVNYLYVHDEQTNPKQIITLPDSNIDTDTLTVLVSPSTTNNEISIYNRVTNLDEVNSDSLVYFIQENKNGQYQIYFGDNIIGKKLSDGAAVYTNYLVTNGEVANKANNFVGSGTLVDSLNESLTTFTVDPISPASGGSERESIDQIKRLSPIQYTSQNRLVTVKDYETYLVKNYPKIDSISVWGGEDEFTPNYGKVFISIKPKEGYYLSETEKENITNNIIKPKSIINIKPEFKDPDYLYLNLNINVQYDSRKTSYSQTSLKNAIRQSVINYKRNYLDKFSSIFAISKLQELIDSTDINSISGSDTFVRAQKRFVPTLNQKNNYVLNYNAELLQGTPSNKLTSNQFDIFDIDGVRRTVTIEEVPKSFSGINSIEIEDPGINYTTEPTVTIVGDGVGATAKAIISSGRITKIEVINSGIDYNKASVIISGGGGFGASAKAIIDSKVGKLRAVYYTTEGERVVSLPNAGVINYKTGEIQLNDLKVLSVSSTDGMIKVFCGLKNNIIKSNRNSIITIDENDSSSIVINLSDF